MEHTEKNSANNIGLIAMVIVIVGVLGYVLSNTKSLNKITENTKSGVSVVSSMSTETSNAKAYTANADYTSPGGKNTIKVDVTLDGTIIKTVSVSQTTGDEPSKNWIGKFNGGVGAEVIGKDITTLPELTQVAGSSLTPKAFNEAVKTIKQQI